MLKTWRLDEDKSIQRLPPQTAGKELIEKRENIHPDFVKKGVEKMEELELESRKHMIEILGSEFGMNRLRSLRRRFMKGMGLGVGSGFPSSQLSCRACSPGNLNCRPKV